MKHCFIVQELGYWGRGFSLKAAAANCLTAGAAKGDKVSATLILGDDKAAITHGGLNITHAEGATQMVLGHGFTIGSLLRLQ